ncbi:hypothetical protein ES703_124440 [subsurface metagenome]
MIVGQLVAGLYSPAVIIGDILFVFQLIEYFQNRFGDKLLHPYGGDSFIYHLFGNLRTECGELLLMGVSAPQAQEFYGVGNYLYKIALFILCIADRLFKEAYIRRSEVVHPPKMIVVLIFKVDREVGERGGGYSIYVIAVPIA